MNESGTPSYSVVGPSIVDRVNSKHGKHVASHDDMDCLENEVTRPYGNRKKRFTLFRAREVPLPESKQLIRG